MNKFYTILTPQGVGKNCWYTPISFTRPAVKFTKFLFCSFLFITLLFGSIQAQTVYLTSSGGCCTNEKWMSITTGANGTGTLVWSQGNITPYPTGNTGGGLLTNEAIDLTAFCGQTLYLNAYDRYADNWDGTVYSLTETVGGAVIIDNGNVSPNDGTDADCNGASWCDTDPASELESSESFTIACLCTDPAATFTLASNCPTDFSITVDVTGVGSGTTVDITNDGGVTATNGVGTGTYNIGPFALGTNATVTVTGDGGCNVDSGVLTEACSCVTTPAATVASANLDCGTGMYDIQVTITSDGSGDTNMTDILIDNAIVQTNATTNTLYTYTVATGMHDIQIQAEGASFVTCVADYMTDETCNGSDDFSTSAPNILGTCSTGDLSIATAGTAQGFTGGCNDNLSVGGSTGNNVIRDCSAENFNNNTNWVDVWYQVDLPDGTDEMTIDLTGLNAGEIVGFSLHTADPGSDASNTQVFSGNSDDCSFFDENITSQTITGLASASTAPIYIRILSIAFDDGAGCAAIVNPTFQICASAPQANDICGNAIDITVNNGGAASTGNLAAASSENTANESETDCASASLTSDLWYKVSTPNSASASDMFRVEYTVDGGNTGDIVVAKIYGPGCFASLIDCQELTFASPVSTLFNNALLSRNSEYYIQLMPKSGTLNNVTSSAIVAPENNICDQFNETFPGYDLADGSAVLDFSLATDTDGNGLKDLWYQINHSSNQSVILSITDAGNWDGELSINLYDYDALGSNIDCDNLVEYCGESGIDDFSFESGVNFNLGTDDYLVRIEETTPDAGGDQLSVTVQGVLSTETIAANASCDNALDITNGTQTGNLTKGQLACPPVSQQDCDGANISSTPFDDFYASTLWYQFTVPTENCTQLSTSTVVTQATIGFSGLTTNSGAGTKQVYVQIYSDCNTVVDCGTASNDSDITFTGLTQGATYFVEVINNTLSSTGTADFTIDQVVFPAPAPCNDNVASAFDLGSTYISGSNFSSGCTTGNAMGATANNGTNSPGSNVNNIWFQFTAAANADEEGYVNIYLESLDGHGMTINVYQEVGGSGGIVPVGSATAVANTTNTDDKAWLEIGHLTIGEDYFIELTHSQAATVPVNYKLCLYDIPTSTIACTSDGVSINPIAGGQCGRFANDCALYYRVEIAAGTPSGWYNFEAIGDGREVDIQLFGQGSDSPSDDGSPSDYDQPCNPTHALNSMAGAQVSIPADGSCNNGSGESAVYNLIGSSTNESNYYYLEVRDANAVLACDLTPDQVCSITASGPFSTQTLAETNGLPDGTCPTLVGFTTATSSLGENGGTVQVCVDITGAGNTPTTVDINFPANAGSATLTDDYTIDQTLAYQVTFPANSADGTTMCITFTGVDDALTEGDETINLTLENVTNGTIIPTAETHTVTISDDDGSVPTIQFVEINSTIDENGGTTQVCAEISNVDGTAVSADVIFDAVDAGTATFSTDYTLSESLPFTLNFPAAAANGDQICFTVTGVNDAIAEGTETINFDLTNPTGTAILGTNQNHTTTIITCEANAGSLPTDPLGCQAITNDIGGTTGFNVLSFGFNNTTDYTQVYFITDGTNVIEAISVAGTGVTPVAVPTAMTDYVAGTYEVYVVNYNNTDATANTSISDLTTLPTTAADLMTIATTYSSGACIIRAANTMTVEVCDPACGCDSGSTTGLVQGLTAVPGSYNTAADYGQTYLLTNTDANPLILDIQETANFTGLVAGTYRVYTLNYSTNAGQNPLVDNGTAWTAITANTTTIDDLSVTPGLADACFALVAPLGTITVDACPTATIVSNNSAICNGESAEFTVNGTSGTSLTYTITGQTGNQTLALTGLDQTITAANATSDVTLTFVSITDAAAPACIINLTNTSTVTVNTCITCDVNAGSIPTDPTGCQAVTNAAGGTTGLNVLSNGFNNMSSYTQVYFITDGTDVIEAISVVGTGATPVAASSTLTNYMAGNYDVYVVNYDNTDTDANTAIADLTGLPTTVTDITTTVATTYSSGACMVRAANAMTIEVCDPVCGCADGTTGSVQALTAVPGSYNTESDYLQTYLLTNTAGLIIDVQVTANFAGLAAGDYQVYSLNYNSAAGESPLADGATWTAITNNTTTIADLSVTPGLADACFSFVAPAGTITVDACPTATIVSNNSAICDTEDAEFTVNGTNGTTLTYTITGQTGNQTLALTGVDQTITAASATSDVTLTFISVADAGTPPCTINLSNTSTITVNDPPVANAISGSNSVCGGSLDEAYSVTNNAGHTYAWSISGGGTLDATTGNSITVDWGTTAGTYTLTVVETETATGCSTTNTLSVTTSAATMTATVTNTAQVCTSATETGNDEGQADLDALVTAGDMTGTWTIVSGNDGNSAMITGTMAAGDVVFDAGTEAGPIILRYTITGTAPCTDQTYDVTVTRVDCGVCSPNVGITRQN